MTVLERVEGEEAGIKTAVYEVNGVKKTGYFSFILISNANRIGGVNIFYKDVYKV